MCWFIEVLMWDRWDGGMGKMDERVRQIEQVGQIGQVSIGGTSSCGSYRKDKIDRMGGCRWAR